MGGLLSCLFNPQADWRHMLHDWHFQRFYTHGHAKYVLQNHSVALHVMLTRPTSLHNLCIAIKKNVLVCSCGRTEKLHEIEIQKKFDVHELDVQQAQRL